MKYPALETDWYRPRAELYELRDSKFNLVDKGLGRSMTVSMYQWADHQHDEPRKIVRTTLDTYLVLEQTATVLTRSRFVRPTLVIRSND